MMKKVMILIVCLFSLSCSKSVTVENANSGGSQSGSAPLAPVAGSSSGSPVTFNLVQPVGQKSNYASQMTMNMNMDAPGSPQGSMQMTMNMGMDMETEVTAVNPDGTWTVESKLSNVKMDAQANGQPVPIPNQTQALEGRSYTATYDKTGKVVSISGVGSTQAEQQIKQMVEQMSPTEFLPKGPVKVGDTWPINFDMPMSNPGSGQAQSVIARGTGKLVEVTGGQAKLDYDLTIEIGGSQMTGSGTGKSSLTYDLDKARMVSNKMNMNFDMSGSVPAGGGTQQFKAKVNMDMQMGLK
jgi:hypothetical protein